MIDLLVVCDLAQISQDGKLSILGIFGEIKGENLPMLYPRFYLVGMLSGIPYSEHVILFSLKDPQGNKVIEEYEMYAQLGKNGKANVINEMTSTRFSLFGLHTVNLTIDREIQRSIPLLVMKPDKTPLQRGSEVVN